MSAFLSACFKITARPASPLAEAVLTYSERSTSSMQARVVRAMLAALAVPRQSAGKSMIVRFRRGSVKKSTQTTGGIQRRVSEKRRISMVPCQKTGTDSPRSVPTRVTLSMALSRRTAERMPAAMPSTSEKATASPVSSMVTGRRSRMSSKTGLPVRQDVPRSPWASWPSQRPYCTHHG